MFKKVIEDLSVHNYNKNRRVLDKVSLFNSLSFKQKDSLAASLVDVNFSFGEKIISEIEIENQMYIIKEGSVSVETKGETIENLKPGSCFGEENLLKTGFSSNTYKAQETPTKCLIITREILQKTLNKPIEKLIENNTILEAIFKSENLSKLTFVQQKKMIKEMKAVNYNTGDIVIPKGTVCSSRFYILLIGKIQNSKNSLLFVDKGNCIGDTFLSGIQESKYEEDLIACCDTKVVEMTKYQFESALGGKFDDVIRQNAAIEAIRKVWLFNSIDSDGIKYLLSIIKIVKFNNAEVIAKEATACSTLFVVKRGKIDVYRAGAK